MADVTFDMSGFKPEQAVAKVRDAAMAALYQFGEAVMTEAKQICPVDTGVLKNSGHVKQPRIENGDILVTLGFGGAASSYAIVVHEDLSARHPSGQAKYLETPIVQMSPQLVPFVAARVKAALG